MENIDPSVYDRADEGLLRLIEKAKIGALSEEEYKVYEASMKILADEMDMEEHGYERGKKEGMISTIKMLIESGMPFSEIANRLKISDEELNALLA
jgi:predicted transposase/invertase (TIGR01784 family)